MRASYRRPLGILAAASLLFSNLPAGAQTVWNINVGAGTGSGTNQITTANNYGGAATENTANSTWNGVTSAGLVTLADSTGSSSAGVTLEIIAGAGSVVQFGNQNLNSGDKIFNTWIKDGTGPAPDIVNDDPFTVTFGNLNPANTYDLVIYADWWWAPEGNPVLQTAGSGLSGVFYVNSQQGGSHVNGTVPPLMEDTNPTDVRTEPTNFARLRGLTPSAGGVLSFSMGGVNAPINGFQLIQIGASPPDTAPPTPSPMTWANVPSATSSTSISMTATTATDTSGVEYFFDETSGNPGGADSGWQDEPSYTNSGLTPNTTYSYIVTARDKSSAGNATLPSAAASATTPAVSITAIWNVNIGGQTIPTSYAGAVAQSTPVTWNSITTSSVTGLALKDSSNSTAAGITLDVSSDRSPGSAALTSGDAIFVGYYGGAGAASTITLSGLTVADTYDIVFYSDWFWKNGDSLPITQTLGTGLEGTFFLNRILSGSNGTVPALTQDTNPANAASGTGNLGNYCRITGIVPDTEGKVRFRIGDGNNTAFSAFQLVRTGTVAPRADILALGLPGNPGVINGTNISLKVPFGSDRSSLAPDFTLWPGASSVPGPGTARDFNTPQSYTVTSSDSLVTKIYTVTVDFHPPLPEFTLSAPAHWDGRQSITVEPVISNLALLQANDGTNFTYEWSTSNVAVTQTTSSGVMTLTRAQGNGSLVVYLAMSNGSEAVIRSATIRVQQPATDPWIERTPLANEKPVNDQFFARNPFTNLGTIYYRGTQSGNPDGVYIKIFRTPEGGAESLYSTHRQALDAGTYDFTATIEAGLSTYRVVYGTTTGGTDTDVGPAVTNLVCGDAFMIQGQSNAVATDTGSSDFDDTTSNWIRTYGTVGSGTAWTLAQSKPSGSSWPWRIGFWGMKLARDIVSTHQVPVCIINGAVGGTRIDQHQPNPVDRRVGAGTYDIYANLLNRVNEARLTHGIRAVFWHQGESDSGSAGPPLEPDHFFYEKNFLAMTSAWKEDFPNYLRYIIYQVAPNPCSLGPYASEVREIQRTLPRLYSNMSVLHNLGLSGYLGCHYNKVGYENMAGRLLSVINRDVYGGAAPEAITPPNLKRAYFTNTARTAITLQFDQPMQWNALATVNFHVNDVANQIVSGVASGNFVTLQLAVAAGANSTLDYVKDSWNFNEANSSLLEGMNGIPALTFANVPVEALAPYELWASSKGLSGPGALAGSDPDKDGLENGLEFVLGGEPNPSNPGSNSVSLLPVSNRNQSGDLVFVFKRKLESAGNVFLAFEWSTDLSFLPANSVPIGETGSLLDGISVSITSHDTATENIIITVPAAKAVAGKLFGRVLVVAP